MPATPLVSIITPVRNAASWLPECLLSVQEQDLEDWQWILIDDHSTDQSAAIIEQAAAKDRRIILKPARGQGILPALQQALSVGQGKYLTRMDADDIMPPGRLRLMAERLNQSRGRTVVTGDSVYFSEEEISEGYRNYQDWLNTNLGTKNPWKGIYRECVVASPNWLVRTKDLINTGGFGNLYYPEDYDLCFRWYALGFHISYIPEITLLWREHSQRTSRVSELYHQRSFFRLKLSRFLEIDYDPQKKLCIWGNGKKARITRSFLREKKTGFVSMALEKKRDNIAEQPLWYRRIEDLGPVQILLAVYPEKEARDKMEEYLESVGLMEGRDYWYL